MRILIIGKNGQLAQSLLARSNLFGIKIINYGDNLLDIEDFSNINEIIVKYQPSIIINPNDFGKIDEFEANYQEATNIVENCAKNFAIIAKNHKIPIIHISSSNVFDGESLSPYTEHNAVSPINHYGRAHLLAEDAIAQHCKDFVILRTSWLYSPFCENFVIKLVDKIKTEGAFIKLPIDQTSCPTSCFDMSDAIFEIAFNLVNSPSNMDLRGVFNACGQYSINKVKFARFIVSHLQKGGGVNCEIIPIETNNSPPNTMRPLMTVLDCTKLLNIHGVLLDDWRKSIIPILDNIINPSKAYNDN